MTNFHVLEENKILSKAINLSIYNGKSEYQIKINDSRLPYGLYFKL